MQTQVAQKQACDANTEALLSCDVTTSSEMRFTQLQSNYTLQVPQGRVYQTYSNSVIEAQRRQPQESWYVGLIAYI